MPSRVAHLIVRGDQLTLQAPYDPSFLEDLKQTIPYGYRRWDRDEKVWLIGCCQAELVSICRAHYAKVIIHDEDAKPPALAQASDWAQLMFTAVPARLHQPMYRTLSKILHPDAGGDLESMKRLTAAYAERRTAA